MKVRWHDQWERHPWRIPANIEAHNLCKKSFTGDLNIRVWAEVVLGKEVWEYIYPPDYYSNDLNSSAEGTPIGKYFIFVTSTKL